MRVHPLKLTFQSRLWLAHSFLFYHSVLEWLRFRNGVIMIYKGFASAYDYLMQDTPYDEWYEHLKDLLKDLKGKEILDLACGTGEMTNRLAKDGYKVLGVDLSPEMLEMAQEKAYSKNLKVHYVQQDMTTLELFHKYDAIISYCDGFNYIQSEDHLKNVFSKVYDYLKPEGLFIFDISSYYKLSEVLGENVIAETGEDIAFIWENYFDPQTELLEFDLTIFESRGDLYERIEEVHVQKAYRLDTVKNLMADSGFKIMTMLDTDTRQAINETSERWLFVGRKIDE